MKRSWAAAAAGGAAAALQARHMRRIARDPARAQLEHPVGGREMTVVSADGTRLHVEIFGHGEAQPVVLAHGWTENLDIWTHVIGQLTEHGLRVVAVDMRGHGKSERAASRDYSVARYGEDLGAVLEQCVAEEERAVVAGHSLGAMAIVAWAEHDQADRRIGAAALINTGLGDLVTEHLLVPVPGLARLMDAIVPTSRVLGARGPLPRFSTPVSYGIIRYAAFGPTTTPAQVAFYERMLAVCPPSARAATGMAFSELELHHALARLTVPTIVIAGEKDRLTPPSHARRAAELLPDLHGVIELKATGHMGPLERPDAVSGALADLAAIARGETAVAA
ncbi:MAG: alpha/beta hydrolase [Solirubrobacterales bacterium]|nr:alpha/beta hydrolase [Solirubrobacterales bacterium]